MKEATDGLTKRVATAAAVILCALLAGGLRPAHGARGLPGAASFAAAAADERADECSLVERLRTEFRKRNPLIDRVEVEEVRRVELRDSRAFLVVAHATTRDLNFRGSFDDELFGLFVIDGSLNSVGRALDIFPTRRWLDYEVKIKSVRAGACVISGRGATYGDQPMRRTYRF